MISAGRFLTEETQQKKKTILLLERGNTVKYNFCRQGKFMSLPAYIFARQICPGGGLQETLSPYSIINRLYYFLQGPTGRTTRPKTVLKIPAAEVYQAAKAVTMPT